MKRCPQYTSHWSRSKQRTYGVRKVKSFPNPTPAGLISLIPLDLNPSGLIRCPPPPYYNTPPENHILGSFSAADRCLCPLCWDKTRWLMNRVGANKDRVDSTWINSGYLVWALSRSAVTDIDFIDSLLSRNLKTLIWYTNQRKGIHGYAKQNGPFPHWFAITRGEGFALSQITD